MRIYEVQYCFNLCSLYNIWIRVDTYLLKHCHLSVVKPIKIFNIFEICSTLLWSPYCVIKYKNLFLFSNLCPSIFSPYSSSVSWLTLRLFHFWLMWLVLQPTWEHMCLFHIFISFSLVTYLVVSLLDHMGVLFLIC